MRNIKSNALLIGKLLGIKTKSEEQIIGDYSSYKMLMPLVYKCNDDENFGLYLDDGEVSLFHHDVRNPDTICRVKYGDEKQFIFAIQSALIDYLKLKISKYDTILSEDDEENVEIESTKKSSLSAKERRAVVEEYLKLKNKTEREIYNEPN